MLQSIVSQYWVQVVHAKRFSIRNWLTWLQRLEVWSPAVGSFIDSLICCQSLCSLQMLSQGLPGGITHRLRNLFSLNCHTAMVILSYPGPLQMSVACTFTWGKNIDICQGYVSAAPRMASSRIHELGSKQKWAKIPSSYIESSMKTTPPASSAALLSIAHSFI